MCYRFLFPSPHDYFAPLFTILLEHISSAESSIILKELLSFTITEIIAYNFISSEGVPVPIFKLIPKDLDNRIWDLSDVNENILVRADSEEEARSFVSTHVFLVRTVNGPDEIHKSPWNKSDLSDCVKLERSGHLGFGVTEILFPLGYDF